MTANSDFYLSYLMCLHFEGPIYQNSLLNRNLTLKIFRQIANYGCVIICRKHVVRWQMNDEAASVVSGSFRLEELALAITDDSLEHQHVFSLTQSHGCGTGELSHSTNNRCWWQHCVYTTAWRMVPREFCWMQSLLLGCFVVSMTWLLSMSFHCCQSADIQRHFWPQLADVIVCTVIGQLLWHIESDWPFYLWACI